MTPRAAHAAYYTAHAAKSLLWTASDLVTIYALISLYGVEPDRAGQLFLIGLAANALADFAVGAWIDRHPEGTPMLAATGLIVAALAFPFTVMAAPLGPGALVVATLAFRLGYAAYDVPHNALLSRLAGTPGMATRLARGRTLGTGAAAALVGLGLSCADGTAGLVWLLSSLAGAAVLGGMVLVPLLAVLPIAADADRVTTRPGLPWRFLLASLVGIVALGALAKALLHLPPAIPHGDAGTILILLTTGRTAAALLPLTFRDARRGLWLLAALYTVVVPAIPLLLWQGGAVVPLVLGLLLGATNLIGWALMPLLAQSARTYGLYTMASKLALGFAGVVMTAALGATPVFAPPGLEWLSRGVMVACAATAVLLASARLTSGRTHGPSRR